MFHPKYHVALSLCLCVLVAACAPSARRSASDMYQLPTNAAVPAHVPVDNDSYYSQPTVYKGCMVINDAPSCGGG